MERATQCGTSYVPFTKCYYIVIQMDEIGYVAYVQAVRNAYKIVIRGYEGERSLWKPGYRERIILK
jgi:hypothetical protein